MEEAKPAIKFAEIFDDLLEGCQIISPEFRYMYVNEAVVKQSRRPRQELLGKTMPECYPGIEKTPMFRLLHDSMNNHTSHTIENDFRFPDGTLGCFELRMEPLSEGVLILSLDITERKQAEARIRQLEELKRAFTEIISRQLQVPLATVQASLDHIKKDMSSSLPFDQAQLIRAAYSAAHEIVEHMDQLNNALAIEGTQHAFAKQSVAFEELWRPVYARYKRLCQAKQIRLLYTDPSMPLPAVQCDPDKIKLVLECLLSNAVAYTNDEGTITVVLDHRDQAIRFEITDTGIGIPATEQPFVFNKYFHGSNRTSFSPDSTGLSLAVARYYVEGHGGTIGFTSRQDQGSSFWFELPLA